jgi:hypothetical protein
MFIERPVIFLGYSLTDEHIAEILEDIVSCFPNTSLEFLQNKLLFVEWKPELKQADISDSVIHKKIPVKYIQAPSYKELFEVLSKTKKRIPAHLFRMIKDELYELVLTDDPKGKLYVRDSEKVEEGANTTEFVVGYDAISMVKRSESMASKGLVGLERVDLIRAVVFENGLYDWDKVVRDVLPNICKGNARIPIFYFLSQAKMLGIDGFLIKDANLPNGIFIRYNITFEKFQSQGWTKRRSESVSEVRVGVNELYLNYDFGFFLRMMPFMEPGLIKRDMEHLLKILKKHIDEAMSIQTLSSDFCKLVCIYDFIKNSNKF